MSDDTKNEVEAIFSGRKYGFYLILFYLCVEIFSEYIISMNLSKAILLLFLATPALAQESAQEFQYRVEAAATASSGTYAPLWLTANRFGMGSEKPNSGYLRAGIDWHKPLKRGWRIDAGLDLAGGVKQASDFWVQQAYADISWKMLTLSIGSKERMGFPLEKNSELTSGWMAEGPNMRPIPQIRAEIKDFLAIPGTRNWLAFKGHLAYGMFTDGNWQEDFCGTNQVFAKKVMYHSKSLMFRLGNKEKLPLEFEFGLFMATQFGGDQYMKLADGSSKQTIDMPDGLKSYWHALFPTAGGEDTPEGEQVNVEGNMLGSWNFALNYYFGDWKVRATLDHYFEDHSQMFWEYGRWKDGQLGIEVYLPKNKWVSAVLWEGISTKDASGPILYDGFWGSFSDLQMSGGDDYYNHYIYQAWQHYGQGIGHPLIAGPAYNEDGTIRFRSNRMKAQHVGISGNPSEEWKWRVMASYARHWGTYAHPLDKMRKQFSSMAEVTYLPQWAKGWSLSAALGLDRGNYLGNSTGGMITLRKTGGFGK